jgi:hypothetical protein
MAEYTRELAKITRTHLGLESHGIFTALLNFDFGGASATIGGYFLDAPNPDDHGKRVGIAQGTEFVMRILRACGVDAWEKVLGRTVFVLYGANRRVDGIENLPTERGERFIFADVMEPVG